MNSPACIDKCNMCREVTPILSPIWLQVTQRAVVSLTMQTILHNEVVIMKQRGIVDDPPKGMEMPDTQEDAVYGVGMVMAWKSIPNRLSVERVFNIVKGKRNMLGEVYERKVHQRTTDACRALAIWHLPEKCFISYVPILNVDSLVSIDTFT